MKPNLVRKFLHFVDIIAWYNDVLHCNVAVLLHISISVLCCGIVCHVLECLAF